MTSAPTADTADSKSMQSMSSAAAINTINTIFVFVFAHPDDESMFFLPTIRSLVDAGQTVWFLCLTTGNYDGLGKIREKEMIEAGKVLGVSKVIVRNDDDDDAGNNNAILDHPTKRWEKTAVAAAIRDSLLENHKGGQNNNNNNRFVLVTFDALGVSGHINHVDTYIGVCHLMKEQELKLSTSATSATTTTINKNSKESSQKELQFLEAWHLESERNFLFKYIPVLSWILLAVSTFFITKLTSTFIIIPGKVATIIPGNDKRKIKGNKTNIRVYRMHNPSLNWKAMATHHSQFVWYRRLFVVFSCYTYYNKFICIKSNIANTRQR